MNLCRACEDSYDPLERRERLALTNQPVKEGELEYCWTCANELFRGVIPTCPVQLHSGNVHSIDLFNKEIRE